MTTEELLTRAVDQILPDKQSLKQLLAKRKIRVYLGIDPTATKLHLGHTIQLRKLQQFAALGHQAILLFGTGTVLVGDPSQRATGRKTITQAEINKNIATWKNQVQPIIDLKKVTIKHNADWLLKLKLKDIINLASKISAVQLFKRDMFQRRLNQGDTVWYHETLYPLLQGYDSVFMDVDLEIGGTDQTFNMLIGRELQQKINHKEKYVLVGKMIMGTDDQPMSKTSGNCIWLTDSATDMFAKLMAITDRLIPDYFEFFTDEPMTKINQITQDLKANKLQPLDIKKQLALNITSQFHGQTQAQAAQTHFQTTFQQKKPEYTQTIKSAATVAATIAPLVGSNSEAKRLINQGAVDINNTTISNPNLKPKPGDKIKIGKKTFVKIK